MSLEVFVVTTEEQLVEELEEKDGPYLAPIAGDDDVVDDVQEQSLAVRIPELISSMLNNVGEGLEVKGTVEVEVTGSIELKAKGGIQYLLFNVGGEAGSQTTMRVKLTTEVSPNPKS